MEALQNLKLVEATKRYASELIANDPTLSNYPELHARLREFDDIHME
jgi:hypothetical protein